jgi:dUTP pyrophosphatase
MRAVIGRMIEWFLSYSHAVSWCGPGDCPYHQHTGDAGYDLYVSEERTVPAGHTVNIPSGIHIEPRSNIWFEIRGRSSTAYRLGLVVLAAVIDRDFRGELYSVVYNPTSCDVVIDRGQRIAQVVPHRLIPVRWGKVGQVRPSRRGERGWGSTGR